MYKLKEVIFFNLYEGYRLKYDPFRKENRYTVIWIFGRIGGDCASFAEAVGQAQIHQRLVEKGFIR